MKLHLLAKPKRADHRARGATASAYALVVGLISIVALTAVTGVGDNIIQLFDKTGDSLEGVATANGGNSTPTASPGDTIAPQYSSVTAPALGFAAGESITFTLAATEPLVTGSGTPQLTLDVGGASRTAAFAGIVGDDATFSYTVQGGDSDTNGIEVTAITVGDLQDAAGNVLDASGFSTVNTGATTTLFSYSSHTFTPCGASGRNGPTLGQCQSAYSSASWISGYFSMGTQGIQRWTVPQAGVYEIVAAGAQGGTGGTDDPGGAEGAVATAYFSLQAGDVLHILVGQQPGDASNGKGGGGGGGSYVVQAGNNPLLIAGGGGGGCESFSNGGNARAKYGGGGRGFTTSQGGGAALHTGGGGAGYSSNGVLGDTQDVARSFTNGGIGGIKSDNGASDGGFGGGGAGDDSYCASGGGGGYQGGASAPTNWNDGGLGGFSYVNTAQAEVSPAPTVIEGDPLSTTGSVPGSGGNAGNLGHGYVTITLQ